MPHLTNKPSNLPTISIITPSFHQGQFIEQTLASVLSQNYPKLEYWVIDGGSTDDTVRILKHYQKRFPNHLRFISEKDRGQTHAINKGIERSTGDIIGYLNSDDCLLPGSLDQVGQYFADHPQTLWLTGDCEIMNEKGEAIQSLVAFYKKCWRQLNSQTVLSILNPIAQPSTFWRRSAGEEIGSFDESLDYCMDYDWWFKLYQLGKPQILHQTLAQFRIHSQSKGGATFEKQFEEELAVAKRYQSSPMLQWLHGLHAWATVQTYKIIKS